MAAKSFRQSFSQLAKSPAIIAAGLIIFALALTFLLYRPGLSGPFLLDDSVNITNSYVGEFNSEEILYAMTHNTSGLLGRPVSMASFLFSGIVHGPEPWGYKYHNLMLHLINGLLIFWLLIRLLPFFNSQLDESRILKIAGATSICWLLHPLLVSTVLYAVQRMAQLSSFFTLVALVIYVFLREQSGKGNLRFYLLAYIAFPISMVLSLLSKENGALIPFFILAVEYIVYGLKFDSSQQRNRILGFNLLFGVLPVVLGGVYLLTHLDSYVNYSTRDYSMVERLMTQLHIVAFYIKVTVLPALSDMSLYHDGWPPVREMGVLTWILFLGLIASVATVFCLRKRAPVIAFGIAWFFISHLMESTFVSLELVFEHRNYLAIVGLIFIPIYYVFTYVNSALVRSLPVIFILLFGFLTATRVNEWKDEETLYAVAVEERPDSLRANTAYASLLYGRGERDKAIGYIEKVSALDPTDFGSILHKIIYLCDTERYSDSMFDEAYRRAEQYPVSASSFYAIDILMSRMRSEGCQHINPDLVMDLIEIAMNLPANRQNSDYLGFLHVQAARVHFMKGEIPQGYENMLFAYEYSGQTAILVDLINTQISLGSFDSAEHLLGMLEERDATSFQSEAKVIRNLKQNLITARNYIEELKAQRASAAESTNEVPEEGIIEG